MKLALMEKLAFDTPTVSFLFSVARFLLISEKLIALHKHTASATITEFCVEGRSNGRLSFGQREMIYHQAI